MIVIVIIILIIIVYNFAMAITSPITEMSAFSAYKWTF